MKTAFIFPGQGSQKIGMLKELAEMDAQVMAVFDRGNEILGRDLKKIMFEGSEEELKNTGNTQPALFISSLAAFEAVKVQGWHADAFAGHSLGEYSALCAAGAIDFEECLKLVQARANAMADAGAASQGTMAAILGLDDEVVTALCEKAAAAAGGNESVQPANFNCLGQVVVSGSKAGLEKMMELAKEAGAKRVMALPVSGAFHSVYMKPASDAMRPALEAAHWKNLTVPVYANVSAKATREFAVFAENLIQQISGSVLWTQSIAAMKKDGVQRYLEIGSGRVLSALVKKNDRDAVVANIEDKASLEKAKLVFNV